MAGENEESVLDIVNAALGDAGDSDGHATDLETDGAPETGDEGSETPPGDDGAADEGAEGSGEGAEGGEADEAELDAEGKPRERNPDGTFKKPSETPAKDGKDGKSGSKPGEQKKPDPINDPIPKDLKPATQERMRALIKTARELEAQHTQVRTDFDMIVGGLQSAGVSPQQYGETLSWLAMFNSGDPEQQGKALDVLEEVTERLATMLGRERTVGDPLAKHADLQKAVTEGKITAQYAREIARTRASTAFRTELTTAANREQEQKQAQEQELQTARNGLSQLEVNLRATDPQYEAKKAMLVPVLQPIFKALPPSQWLKAFQEAYKKVQVAAPAARPGNGVPARQPLRANKTPAGGTSKAPTSGLEAIDAALANMK